MRLGRPHITQLCAALAAIAFAAAACGDDSASAPEATSNNASTNSGTTGGTNNGTTSSDPNAPAWSTHVAPMFAENCTSCHTEGGAAPFALDTYESVKTYGALALDSMESGRMPPWQPDPTCRPIKNSRILDPADIGMFRDWIDTGAARGPDVDLPEPEASAPFTPTHTAGVTAPYTPKIGESDDYRCFILDMDFDRTMYLTGSNVHPGNGLVHHVLVYALTDAQAEEAATLDAAEDGPGYTCFGGPIPLAAEGGAPDLRDIGALLESLSFPNQIGAWVPGASPENNTETAIRIAAGSTIVMQVHYSAVAGAIEADSETEYQAILTETPPANLIESRPLAQRALEIPAGEADVEASITVPYYADAPLMVAGIAGHMHLLGTRITAEVERQDGEMACGLRINSWDFNWQESYKFSADNALMIESGDRVKMTCGYDNSAANQPVVNGVQQDPRDVAWGDGTLDEMCLTYLQIQTPFSAPTVDDDAPSCAACADTCGDDIACLARCGADDLACVGCALDTVLNCDAGQACIPDLLAASGCIRPCIESALMLRGNFGACMEAECGDAWTTAADCMTDALGADACAEASAACGL